MEYTKSNPEVNRLQLVSPLGYFSWTPLSRSSMTLSSQRLCPVRHIFTSSGSFTEILKGYSWAFVTHLASHLPVE